MNNFEKYKDDEALETSAFGLVNGKPKKCCNINCGACEFNDGLCTKTKMEWLKAEYEEPKINLPKDLPIDAKIEVSPDGIHWEKRHFAEFADEGVNTWSDGQTSWTTDMKLNWSYARLPKEQTGCH